MISTISPKRNFERMVDENFDSLPSNHHYSPSKLNYPKKLRTQEKLIELKHQFQNDSPFKIKEPFEIDMNVVKRLKRRREMQNQKGNNNNNNNNFSHFNNNNNNNNSHNISPYNNITNNNNNNNTSSPFNFNSTPFQYNSPNKNQVISNNFVGQQSNNDPSSEKEKLLSEQLFSANDVKKIVEERENKLINEFTQILLERLDQQYQTFAQYTEDCLSRQMKSSEFDDYIS